MTIIVNQNRYEVTCALHQLISRSEPTLKAARRAAREHMRRTICRIVRIDHRVEREGKVVSHGSRELVEWVSTCKDHPPERACPKCWRLGGL